jgi:hypothetical protein
MTAFINVRFDANQTARLVAAMADTAGISYLRTLRPATKVLYGPDEEFEIGGSRILRSSENDEVALIGAGITVHEALAAADELAEDGISARVIDLYSIKPLDVATLRDAVEATQGRLVTVEDHWAEGGLGDAVLAALADEEEPPRVVKLAVREMPKSGKPDELLAAAGIDAEHIAAAARGLVAESHRPSLYPSTGHGGPLIASSSARSSPAGSSSTVSRSMSSAGTGSRFPARTAPARRPCSEFSTARPTTRAASSFSPKGRGLRCTTSGRRSTRG